MKSSVRRVRQQGGQEDRSFTAHFEKQIAEVEEEYGVQKAALDALKQEMKSLNSFNE